MMAEAKFIFRDALWQALVEADVTPHELADELGVPLSTVLGWLDNTVPRKGYLTQTARILKVPVSQLQNEQALDLAQKVEIRDGVYKPLGECSPKDLAAASKLLVRRGRIAEAVASWFESLAEAMQKHEAKHPSGLPASVRAGLFASLPPRRDWESHMKRLIRDGTDAGVYPYPNQEFK